MLTAQLSTSVTSRLASLAVVRDVRFGLQMGQIVTKFERAKMNRILILKSPKFVTFGANLAQWETNMTSMMDVIAECVTREFSETSEPSSAAN